MAGHHLKELRKSVGKTQSEVAAALGISQARVSQIENGDLDSMGLETIRAYAAALVDMST
ncbi:helix-turn-helix transcriptional regulator [Nonomuraea sp. NPDC004580]|uniref:helix-turn-helix domain-containing protein n=1 Tax=Nonomuraea sp. NPDC004580 TaxID=3154552 RepID=UPI0033B44103